jgi:hypothetical protein
MEKILPNWDLNDIGIFTIDYFKKSGKPFTEDTMIDILMNQQNKFGSNGQKLGYFLDVVL